MSFHYFLNIFFKKNKKMDEDWLQKNNKKGNLLEWVNPNKMNEKMFNEKVFLRAISLYN